MKFRMSSLVTRPPKPVPATCSKFTPCSRAMLRTNGDERTFDFSSVSVAGGAGGTAGATGVAATGAATGGAAPGAAGVAAGAGAGAGSGAGAAAVGADAAAAPASPIRATTALTATVSPSWCRISVITPAAGEGTSVSTLSVETSRSGSSRPIVSPTFFNHLTIVPSAMDSPI